MTDVTGSDALPSDAFSLRSPYGRRAVGLSIAAAVGGFLFGFDSSVINGAVADRDAVPPSRSHPALEHQSSNAPYTSRVFAAI